jgi:hypothetical protein
MTNNMFFASLARDTEEAGYHLEAHLQEVLKLTRTLHFYPSFSELDILIREAGKIERDCIRIGGGSSVTMETEALVVAYASNNKKDEKQAARDISDALALFLRRMLPVRKAIFSEMEAVRSEITLTPATLCSRQPKPHGALLLPRNGGYDIYPYMVSTTFINAQGREDIRVECLTDYPMASLKSTDPPSMSELREECRRNGRMLRSNSSVFVIESPLLDYIPVRGATLPLAKTCLKDKIFNKG